MALAIWKPLVICGKSPISTTTPITDVHSPCQFPHIIGVARNLITDLIVISTLLTVIAIITAGFILIFSGGNESAKKRAKDIFKKVLIGYIVILIAWVLVYTITNALVDDEYNYLK